MQREIRTKDFGGDMSQNTADLGLAQVRALIATEDSDGRLAPCGLSSLIVGPDALDRVPSVVGDLVGDRLKAMAEALAAGLLLGFKAIGAHETVAVERFSITEADDVHHAIAVEGVIALQRRV